MSTERDQIVAQLAVAGLDYKGTTASLRKRLLAHMLDNVPPVVVAEPAEVPDVTDKVPDKVPDVADKAPDKKKRKATAYNLFVKEHIPLVTARGFKGKHAMAEIARLWKEKKEAPVLMLEDKSTSVEALIDSLFALSVEALKACLAANGKATTGTKDELCERLAMALLQ